MLWYRSLSIWVVIAREFDKQLLVGQTGTKLDNQLSFRPSTRALRILFIVHNTWSQYMYNYFRNAISFVRFFLIYAEICWVCVLLPVMALFTAFDSQKHRKSFWDVNIRPRQNRMSLIRFFVSFLRCLLWNILSEKYYKTADVKLQMPINYLKQLW